MRFREKIQKEIKNDKIRKNKIGGVVFWVIL